MTRAEKIGKLARAVKDWRGATDAKTGKWRRPPQPKAVERVLVWITRLNLNPDRTLPFLAGLKSYSEFDQFLRDLGNYDPSKAPVEQEN
jgi:hypothetical protein